MDMEKTAVISKSGWQFWIIPNDSAIFVATSGLWGENSIRLVCDAMSACRLCQTRTFIKIKEGGRQLTGVGFNYPSDEEDVKAETVKKATEVLKDYNPKYPK